MSTTQADLALRLLCELLERPEEPISPDAIRYSGEAETFRYLQDLGALAKAEGICRRHLCHWCGAEDLVEVQPHGDGYRGYCTECGWIALTVEDVTPLRVDGGRIARWLAAAVGLAREHRYEPEEQVPGQFWRLGEVTFNRKARTVFFGRRLHDPELVPSITHQVVQTCVPGRGVIVTSSPEVAPALLATGHAFVPLRAVVTLRKAGFAIDGLDAYWSGAWVRKPTSEETSLRLLRSARVALIDGEEIPLSRQVCDFLCMLEDARGEPVHKAELAVAMETNADTFKGAQIFKRHKRVYDTFVRHDREGRYWLKPLPPA
jgi:hypothetical protein